MGVIRMDRAEIYGGAPLNVAEVEKLTTALALDEREKTADRLRALDLLHDWAQERCDFGTEEQKEREQLKIRLEVMGLE